MAGLDHYALGDITILLRRSLWGLTSVELLSPNAPILPAQALSAKSGSVSIEANGAIAISLSPTARQSAPVIVQLIDERLSPVSNRVGLLVVYVVGDCVLLVTAAALLVAF